MFKNFALGIFNNYAKIMFKNFALGIFNNYEAHNFLRSVSVFQYARIRK
jgi:hypothetical protein